MRARVLVGFFILLLLLACASVPLHVGSRMKVVVEADRAAEANDAVALRTMTASSLRRIAPQSGAGTVTVTLTEPMPLMQPYVCRPAPGKVTLAFNAYPVVGSIPVVARQGPNETMTGIRVGTVTIADEEGRVVESLPIAWPLRGVSRPAALRLTADAIALSVSRALPR